MSYTTVQTGFATVIKKISGYDGDNVKENADYRILGHGKERGVVLSPGTFEQRPDTLRDSTIVTWRVQVQLFVLYDGEMVTSLVTLMTEREKIIDQFNLWPNLGAVSGVLDAQIESGEVPGRIENQWLVQDMVGVAIESKTFSRSE